MLSYPASVEKAVAVALIAALVRMVHRSLSPCAPTPSVTHKPAILLGPGVVSQYAAPLTMVHKAGGAEGGAGGARGPCAQMVKPAPFTEPSEYQEIVSPILIETILGPLEPL